MFIEKLEHCSDYSRMLSEANEIINNVTWNNGNQIGLNRRVNSIEDIWKDAAGSIFDANGKRLKHEREFTEWNINENYYIRQQIESLLSVENIKHGRIRIMRLLPKTGLSVHSDYEHRYHYVLSTNSHSFVCQAAYDMNTNRSDIRTSSVCYHLPLSTHWYKINTKEIHWVYNGGSTERIHLVVCSQ